MSSSLHEHWEERGAGFPGEKWSRNVKIVVSGVALCDPGYSTCTTCACVHAPTHVHTQRQTHTQTHRHKGVWSKGGHEEVLRCFGHIMSHGSLQALGFGFGLWLVTLESWTVYFSRPGRKFERMKIVEASNRRIKGRVMYTQGEGSGKFFP